MLVNLIGIGIGLRECCQLLVADWLPANQSAAICSVYSHIDIISFKRQKTVGETQKEGLPRWLSLVNILREDLGFVVLFSYPLVVSF